MFKIKQLLVCDLPHVRKALADKLLLFLMSS